MKHVESVEYKISDDLDIINTVLAQITLKDFAALFSTHVSMNIPIPLLKKVKNEFERMEKNNVVTKVTEPTEW